MDLIHTLLGYLHQLGDLQALKALFAQYGTMIFLLMFIIIFAETGFVVTPFLPGDSLLFGAGIVVGLGGLNIVALFFLLVIAAILGNVVNYSIGRFVGPSILEKEKIPFIKKKHLISTHEYYEKNGAFAIIMGRFTPFIRTFVPFVAGIGYMDRKKFITYTLIGAIAWVTPFLLGGYFLSSIPWVQDNFKKITTTILILSVLPFLYGVIKELRSNKAST